MGSAATRGAHSLTFRPARSTPSGSAAPDAATHDLLVDADRTTDDVHVLACAECPRVSTVTARGWKGYRSDDPDTNEPPRLSFYCPECAHEHFGV